MRTTIKILRKTHRDGTYEYRDYCYRCHDWVHSFNRGFSKNSWVTKPTAVKHALAHLQWHQQEDLNPLPQRDFWKDDWPTISEVSDGDEKEIVA